MSLLTTSSSSALATTEEGALLVRTMYGTSVAFQICQYVSTDATIYRYYVQSADPSAAWTAEDAEIALSDPTIVASETIPRKLAGLTRLSNELVFDSPVASEAVMNGLARDLGRKVDSALFATVTATNAPAGLVVTGGYNEVDAGASWTDLDPFDAAIANAEDETAQVNFFVANSATALALAGLKEATGSNRPLLDSDPTLPTRKVIRGVPLVVSPYVEDDVVWAIPTDRIWAIVRRDVSIEVSDQAFFTRDATAVRGVVRASFAYPHMASVSRIELTA